MAKNLTLRTEVLVFENESQMSSEDASLYARAKKACNLSYAPYSGFCVGAAILLENGEIVEGANQENAAYPSGLCAERVALFACGVQFPQGKILAMAIAARRMNSEVYVPASPCGACRQVMIEFEERQKQGFSLIFEGGHGRIFKIRQSSDLMPFVFSGKSLGL